MIYIVLCWDELFEIAYQMVSVATSQRLQVSAVLPKIRFQVFIFVYQRGEKNQQMIQNLFKHHRWLVENARNDLIHHNIFQNKAQFYVVMMIQSITFKMWLTVHKHFSLLYYCILIAFLLFVCIIRGFRLYNICLYMKIRHVFRDLLQLFTLLPYWC